MKTKRTRNVNSNQPSRSTWLDTLQILSLALLVRLLTTLTLWLVPLHLPAFDKSADAVLPPQDRWIQGFLRWDALYFLKIAEEGYTRENEFAFMPALPAVMRGLGMAWEERWMPSVKGMLLPAVVFANVAALGAAVLFHRLSLRLLRDQNLAYTAAALYVFSPSPATFSSPYNEPFFALASFSGMLALELDSTVVASLSFAFATAFRANGVLNAGFFVWYLLLKRWKQTQPWQWVTTIVCGLIACAPFIAFQWRAYQLLCSPSPSRPWCRQSVPLIYSFVQDHYWDVGFLRYWTLLQLPLFLLSAPVLCMSFRACWTYYSSTPWLSLSLPFAFSSPCPSSPTLVTRKPSTPTTPGFSSNPSFLPYVHLHTALTCLLFFASHVQICLRLAPTMPVIYWHAAERYQKGERWWWRYCLIWAPLSVVLWAGFYPPA